MPVIVLQQSVQHKQACKVLKRLWSLLVLSATIMYADEAHVHVVCHCYKHTCASSDTTAKTHILCLALVQTHIHICLTLLHVAWQQHCPLWGMLTQLCSCERA